MTFIKYWPYSSSSRHPSVTNDNGLASPFGERVFLLQEMRPDKNNMKVKEKKGCHLNNIMN